MAGDWIKMRGNLWDDPRIAAICDATGASEAAVIGALYWLWATADQHTDDGCMPGLSLRQIDRKTGVQGFGAALVSIGWLADDPQGVVLSRFEEHNGSSAKKRAQTASRVAKHRAANADETQESEDGNAPSVTPALAREEKRREEKEIQPVESAAADTTPLPAPPMKAKDIEAEGVDRQKAADWLALRKAKRLPLTRTAWADTKAEGAKAGLNPAQTVATAVANNWAGFKAAWLQRDASGKPSTSSPDPFAGSH